MIVENQLDRGAGRIGSIKKLEEFDELPAAVAISEEGMDLAGEQIDAGQQAERAIAFVLMITCEGRVDARDRRQIGRGRCDGLNTRLFVIGDDRDRLAGVLRLGGLFQDLDLAINTQNFRHLLLELGVAPLQIVSHLVRLDFLLGKNLAYRTLHQVDSICARCTRRAASFRDRAMPVSLPISSAVIANSTAWRHLAMMSLLV